MIFLNSWWTFSWARYSLLVSREPGCLWTCSQYSVIGLSWYSSLSLHSRVNSLKNHINIIFLSSPKSPRWSRFSVYFTALSQLHRAWSVEWDCEWWTICGTIRATGEAEGDEHFHSSQTITCLRVEKEPGASRIWSRSNDWTTKFGPKSFYSMTFSVKTWYAFLPSPMCTEYPVGSCYRSAILLPLC
jgi:hypothetical protein